MISVHSSIGTQDMYMGIPFQISAEGMKGDDIAGHNLVLLVLSLMPVVSALLNLLIVICIHDCVAGGFEKKIEPLTMPTEIDAQAVIDGEYHMAMLHIESVAGNAFCPQFRHAYAAGRTEARFAGKADNVVPVAVRTFIDVKAHFDGSTVDHCLYLAENTISDV